MLVPHIPTIIYEFVGPSDTALLLQNATCIANNSPMLFSYDHVGGTLEMHRRWEDDHNVYYGLPTFRFKSWTGEEHRPLTAREYGKICFLREFKYKPHIPYGNPDCPCYCLQKPFITVRDVERFIEASERIGRFLPSNYYEWSQGADCSHIYFEGLKRGHNTDGSFSAAWGS